MARQVTIIVLAWNRWALTERCLASLRRCTDLAMADVIVVDNGSTDETPGRLAHCDWIRTLTNESNLGYVRGNNVGIAAASPRHDILLLNNDVEIKQTGWLEELSRVAHQTSDIGIVGCRLTLPDGRLLHAGTYVPPDTLWGQQIGGLEAEVNQYAGVREVEGVVFACAYIKRETLAAVGGLSEEFVSYFEDSDYCLRAKAAGFRTVCHGGVTLVHQEHGSTSDNPAYFQEVFRQSQRTFARKWGKTLEDRYRWRVGWQSIMNLPTGYATSCRGLLRGLDRIGVRIAYSYVYGPGTPFPLVEPDDSGDYLLNLIRNRASERWPRVSVVYGQGDVFQRNRGRYRIGYTMLEVDGFPSEWVRQANLMDEVWVPSAFNRDAMRRCGVSRPIQIMPLGVDLDHFHPGIRAEPNPRGDFIFLANFEWGERKQPELLLRTFNATFRHREPVALLCKVSNRNPVVNVGRQIEALRLKSGGGRIGFIFNRTVPYEQLGMLYRSADCYVSAGHGEGWDMPLMEAMACGLPAIATDWGAHTEFVRPGIAYPLAVRGTVPARAACPYYAGFSWADPDPEHLGELLRHVFEHREEAQEVGARAAVEMASRWSWQAAAERVAARLSVVGA